jgi:hypothetical protein
MPKIVGTRERVHQPFYDTLLRVDGSTNLRTTPQNGFGAVTARSQLFQRSGADQAITNLSTGGAFASDQTFVVLAVRVWTYFRFNAENLVVTPAISADRIFRVHKLYHQSQNQIFWELTAGDKPQLVTFTAYTPFAGGLDGFFADSRLPRANNGVPTSSALMRLARPILIPPRQGFKCIATISSIGPAVGSDLVAQLNGLTAGGVEAADNIAKDLKYLIDGIWSRDVL